MPSTRVLTIPEKISTNKTANKAIAQGGYLKWFKKTRESQESEAASPKQIPESEDWRVRGSDLLRKMEEQREIREVRDGIRSGPTAWLIPSIEDSRPLPLPPGVDLESLTPSEMKVAVLLGIVTLSVISEAQQARYFEGKDLAVPEGTVGLLLGKLARQAAQGQKPRS